MKITADTIISDVLRINPDAVSILMSFGMGCLGCPASQMESLEEAAAVHGLDVEPIIIALNKDLED